MDSVLLIEVLTAVVVVSALTLFTLQDLIARYPAPFLNGDDQDDSDAD